MSFTPLYQLKSLEVLAPNLVAIFQRDQVDALNWAASGLSRFAYFGTARRVDQLIFPACFALPIRISMTQSSELTGVQMRQEITLEVADVGADPEKLRAESLSRIRAVAMMTLSAQPADIFEGVDLNAYGGLAWDVQEIAPNQFPRQNALGQYLQIVQALAVFTYLEM